MISKGVWIRISRKEKQMEDLAYSYMDWPRIEAVVYGEEKAPKDVMAPKVTSQGILIQGFFPEAKEAAVITGGKSFPMVREDQAGYYAVMVPGKKIPEYRFRIFYENGEDEFYDPYAFPEMIYEEEERAFLAGVFYEAYQKLGSHSDVMNQYGTHAGVSGTYFAVWAPNAVRVSVVGDFNQWDGRRLPMHRMPMSGIFELFIPELGPGHEYLYEIKTRSGNILLKADPYAARSRMKAEAGRPPLVSVTGGVEDFDWDDEDWLCERGKFARRDLPVSILEVKLTEWDDWDKLAKMTAEEGFTHVELLPVMEFLDSDSDGYSTAGYFSVTSRFALPSKEGEKDLLPPDIRLKKLVSSLHRLGIGVIADWMPAQFPRFYGGLELFDGTVLYERPEPAQSVHPIWGTMLYHYESPMVTDFLISNAMYWINEFHFDGLRLDDVDAMLYLDYGRQNDSWTPNYYGTNENLAAVEFLKHLNSLLHRMFPGVLLIAQEDGLWPQLTDNVDNDHLGFDYKWSSGWTKDFLEYLTLDPIMRAGTHDQLTLSMLYAYCEHYILTLGRRDIGSLSSFCHKLPGNADQKFSQVREALAYMLAHPGCKMTAGVHEPFLFDDMGSETLFLFMHDLNILYKNHPALYAMDSEAEGFEWIQLTRAKENVLAFLRKTTDPSQAILVLANFAAVDYEGYTVGVPFPGEYVEIFNTDNTVYGGSGLVNSEPVLSKAQEWDERENSISLNLAGLSVVFFACTPASE